MKFSGQTHRSIQKNLFQMATMNVDIWFAPAGDKAHIYKGNIFEQLSVSVDKGAQLGFSFIPEEVRLSDTFYNRVVKDRAMPFQADMIMKASSPIEHDLILWLCTRQSSPSMIGKKWLSYEQLQPQFGRPGQDIRKFRLWFKRALKNVAEKFGRNIEIESKGIYLHPMTGDVRPKLRGW